jgi:hypothetical protein
MPPFKARTPETSTSSSITHTSGSENIERKILRLASFMRSPENTDGESNVHTKANPESHNIDVAASEPSKYRINGNGATAAKARCAAKAYLEINLCT